MITITLNKIKAEFYPDRSGYHLFMDEGSRKELLNHLGKTEADDDEFPLAEVLKSNGLDGALWCLRCLPEHNSKWRLLAIKFARQVQHLMRDERSINALNVAEKHAKGEATDEELKTAYSVALAAAETFPHSWSSDYAPDWAAIAAAGGGNARDPASDACSASREALTAYNRGPAYNRDPACDAARQKQEQLFLKAIQ